MIKVMSLVMEILEDLWNIHLYYKGVKVNMLGVPMLWESKKDHSKNSFDSTISRLKKKGFLETKSGKWILTKAGKEYFENKKKLSVKFASSFVLNAPKNLLLMFDIPESKKIARNVFRSRIKELGFFQFQKSVWVYPYPCENEVDFLAEYFEIAEYIHFLTIKIEDDNPLCVEFGL